ncbi:MAG: hypothetical protein QS748_01890 [Candidatus Endonucleobacter bathymodioli]|uniref:Uncharacterized protein n=1 Tax=Candidatus Endonucleibacter bathymodioli TaxID=539814 RepID=A0AA90NWA6_9GAMM|nr:hypothetical protein [Candidatus Endonucleobacter bathymodioli]
MLSKSHKESLDLWTQYIDGNPNTYQYLSCSTHAVFIMTEFNKVKDNIDASGKTMMYVFIAKYSCGNIIAIASVLINTTDLTCTISNVIADSLNRIVSANEMYPRFHE